MAMKCFHINRFKTNGLQHTLINNKLFSTNILKKPSTGTFNHTFHIPLCKHSLNQAEVVTACSWTELVVAADMAVLVMLWEPWCERCQMIAPMVDEIAKEYTGKALCYKLNTEDYPNVASQYAIKSIPTTLFFKDGEQKEIVSGVVPKSALCATLDKYVEQ